MQKMDGSTSTRVVVDPDSATVEVNGRGIELPLREFRLVLELARNIGKPIPRQELIKAIWPDEPWTPKETLYNLVTKVRRLLEESDGSGIAIRNRRDLGYSLDLDEAEITVAQPPPSSTAEDVVIRLDTDDEAAAPDVIDLVAAGTSTPLEANQPRRRQLLWTAAVVTALVGGSWAAGYLLSSHLTSRPRTLPQHANASPQPSSKSSDNALVHTRHHTKTLTHRHSSGRKTRAHSDHQHLVAGAPATGVGGAAAAPQGSAASGHESPQRSHQTTSKTARQSHSDLPPAPTRDLYVLVNPKSGDHFVTTDGGVASEYQAKGYRGGAIAFIYTSSEQNTKAISTDAGTAYIFTTASPQTRPSSRTATLWYSTNDDGDFFYTTSQSEAQQDGWHASAIGYVRSL